MEAGLQKASNLFKKKGEPFTPAEVFGISSTLGVRYTTMKEALPEAMLNVSPADFEKERLRHREISRSGVEKKFGGHGLILNTGELKATSQEEVEQVTRLHTVTHLLQAALQRVLGDQIGQRGSDITALRTRFDFSFDRKLTEEEISQVEKLVNDIIQQDLPVNYLEVPLEEAKKSGATYFFKGKYPPVVKVYYVGESIDTAFSKELCGGPHASRTGGIGKFRIKKQEAVGEGIRRIKAVLEK
ncbi:MAG: hypothetical protein A2Y84_02235 [Candidatus Colwellbacteria bacterium RBG_13_48_8]|uniref:alanine--tRNA ligase n=1 Tax=Candidatus Colwellbacteria bacterium RBG_13_48_8 TaxID=1797685 RepID=A0A1G1YXD3_9BACT|nr:MAG: hypothetical protein A2Y84_02235 [Candidatus Colwellbacteria bacterium RBG_13_48_8]